MAWPNIWLGGRLLKINVMKCKHFILSENYYFSSGKELRVVNKMCGILPNFISSSLNLYLLEKGTCLSLVLTGAMKISKSVQYTVMEFVITSLHCRFSKMIDNVFCSLL
jgi:hypothetical protein